MKFKLENPEHQRKAINCVVEIFRGMEKNTYDNSTDEDIRANYCSLSSEELHANIQRVSQENNIPVSNAYLQETSDACIEMETGTGKTLTYIQTAYELNKEYGLTKFIVLVPSVPIRQGAIDTFENFKEQLEDKYEVSMNAFVYDSSRLSYLRDFITAETPQIMIMTLASFNSEVKQNCFKRNTVYLATDGNKEAYITVDANLKDETVEYFMQHTDKKFICIERALDTTKKFNLKEKMQEKFFAF